MVNPIDFLTEKLQILEKRDKIAIERTQKYDNMTYSQVLQCPENKLRLKNCKNTQKGTFDVIIKRRHPELIKNCDELFSQYFTAFLAGKAISINDFLYIDISVPIVKRKLKPEFIA